MPNEDLHSGLSFEDPTSRQQPVRQASDRVDVGPTANRLITQDLFRSHEGRRSLGRALDRKRSIGLRHSRPHADQSEVHHLHEVHLQPVAADVHVGWLDVAVYEAPLVRLGQGLAHLAEEVNGAIGPERPVTLDERVHVQAVEQLHDVVERPVGRNAEIVQLDRVRRTQQRRRVRFPLEPLPKRLTIARHHVRADQLDGRRTREHPVLRPPNLPHASATEALDQTIAPQLPGRLHLASERCQHVGRDQRQACRQVVEVVRPDQLAHAGSRAASKAIQQIPQRVHARGRQGGEEHLSWRVRDDDREEQDQEAHLRDPPAGHAQALSEGLDRHAGSEGQEYFVHETGVEKPRWTQPLGACDEEHANRQQQHSQHDHVDGARRIAELRPAKQGYEAVDDQVDGYAGGDRGSEDLQAASSSPEDIRGNLMRELRPGVGSEAFDGDDRVQRTGRVCHG